MKAIIHFKNSKISWNRISIILKTFLVLGMLALLNFQIFSKGNLTDLSYAFNDSFSWANVWLLILTIVLVPVNWFLESVKWKTIISPFTNISFRQSYKVILGGLSFGILTPSRIGEYGGRFYMMEDKDRWKTISATFVGSLSQNLVTAILGLAGATYLLFSSSIINEYLATSIWYIASISIIIGALVYYRIGFIQNMVRFLPDKWAELLDQHSNFLTLLNVYILNKVLILSIIRYLVYAIQYVLLLYFFGVVIAPAEAFATVSLLFLIQTGLPFPPIFDVLARGEIALMLWSLYSDNSIGILATAFGLWVINLIIPALIGLIYVIVHKA